MEQTKENIDEIEIPVPEPEIESPNDFESFTEMKDTEYEEELEAIW